MEELRDPHPAERARNGTARSLCGCGERPGSSAAERMGDYTEIFGGFASSCSIPVLVLPETMDGYGEALAGPKSLNYLEIFGALDAWSVPMSYEELVSMEKGSKEEDNRFQEETNVGLVETEASVLDAKVLIEDHITFTKVNQASSSFHSHLDKEQPNISGRTSQQRIVDEAKSKIFLSGPLFNYEPNFEAEAVSSTGSIKDESPKNFGSYDHIIHRDIEEEKERGKQKEILNGCFVGATVDDSKNDLKDDHESSGYSLPDGNTENLKQHSRSSSYHSTSSGDVTFSDYAFLTISDINLRTQPLQVPPPSRAPPSLDRNTEKFKSEALEASNATFNKELIPETYKSYNSHHIGGPRTRHALKETVKTNSHTNLNVEVDASSAAAASAAAMKEAMEQAQASLKSAKELMERKRDSPQNGLRQDPHDFRTWNEQNINFTGRSRYKTKIAKKVVPNQLERVNSAFSEDIEEAIQGKGSRFKLSLDENERSHEWKVDKQFYELIGNDKLMRTREMNDEKYNSNEEIKLVHQLSTNQFFPEKEAFGKQRKMFSQSENDNEVKKLNKYRISEKTSYSGGGLHLPDGNAKKLKLANRVDNEKIPDILETSATPSVQGDDEDKQKAGPVLINFNGRKVKVEDTISLIQRDKNENELKEFKESHTYGVGKKNEGDNKEHNTFGWNDSGFPDFYDNRKLEEFDVGEPVGKKLGQGIECNQIHGASINSEYDSLNNYEHMEHSSRVYNSNVTYEFTLNKNIEVKLSNLQNANEVEVNAENRTSVSIDKEKNLEDLREECHLGKFKKTRRDGYIENYIKEKDSELEDIDNTSEQEVSGSFSNTEKNSEPENDKKLYQELRDKLGMSNRGELKIAKLSVQPDFVKNLKESLVFQKNEEEEKVCKLPQKIENYVDKLTTDGEKRKGEKHVFEKVQAALELEKKIKGLSVGQQALQGVKVQNYEAVQQANSLDTKANVLIPYVDSPGGSLKQIEKSLPDERRDANVMRKEISDKERKEAEQKRKLEERAREREKDRISVEKTAGESCENVIAENREKPERISFERVAIDARKPIIDITVRSSSEVFERSEKVANEAKLRAERAAVERATTEARERAIERALAEQASVKAKRQAETLVNSKIGLKPTSNAYDVPNDLKSHSAGREEESPLRCKARQERCQRVVERAAKALEEKNMRDLLSQREQAERNRLAESLDVEVRRWSNGKEGNLRALLSTLQYILGHDSGWQPIPLTEVITAADARKAYRKATLYVHPDKLQQRGASIHHKYICEKVFDLLKDAWNKFNSEG